MREWLTAVDLLAQPGDELTDRTVLYALAEAAVLTDSLTVEHGNRSLAVATGLDQSTVGRILRRLLEAPSDRSLIDLVRPAHGVRSHTYLLHPPSSCSPPADAEVHVFPGASHLTYVEMPDAHRSVVAGFLARRGL